MLASRSALTDLRFDFNRQLGAADNARPIGGQIPNALDLRRGVGVSSARPVELPPSCLHRI